jgi:hypothetical protein
MDKNIAFTGMNGFIWWTGVVENRNDPLNLCRCQVRIFGWHTENKKLIPTEQLPWAQALLPPNASSQSKTPLEGDWVVGFFYDGASGQFPVIMGVLPAIPYPTEIDPKTGQPTNYTPNPDHTGFQDARSEAQLASSPIPYGASKATHYPNRLGEPTTSRLYRNEKLDQTQIGKRNATRKTGIRVAGGGSWNEPKSPYAAKPPYNDVKESESGHLFEFDDTPTAERVNLSHKSGTYFEMRPDGSRVTKVKGNNYEIIAGDDFVNITGTCNITIDGNANIHVGGDALTEVGGDLTAKVTGSVVAEIGNDCTMTVGGTVNAAISGNLNAQAAIFNFDGPIVCSSSIVAVGNIVSAGDLVGAAVEIL